MGSEMCIRDSCYTLPAGKGINSALYSSTRHALASLLSAWIFIHLSVLTIYLSTQISYLSVLSLHNKSSSQSIINPPTNQQAPTPTNQPAKQAPPNQSPNQSIHLPARHLRQWFLFDQACSSRCASPKPWRSWGSWRVLSFHPSRR